MKYLIYFLSIIIILFSIFFIYKNYFQKEDVAKNSSDNDLNDKSSLNLKEYKIVAFGDSLTAGYGVDLADSYPSILEKELNKKNIKINNEKVNYKIINMGVSGETTSGGLSRADFVLSQNPDLILLGLGANDMLRSIDPSLAKNNLENIIKKIKEKNVNIILLGMESQASNGFNYKIEFDEIYPSLAKKYNLPLVSFFLKGVAFEADLNTADGIHPNQKGYEKIVNENIMPILISFLEKRDR